MSRLARIERAAHRFDDWLDRVCFGPAGLTLSIAAVYVLLMMGWLP